MEWLESLVLGVVQGITEFLPVSSDGHLLLTQNLFGWLTGVKHTGKENLFFDVILHLGTTAAILIYNREVIAKGLARAASARNRQTRNPVFAARRSSAWGCWRSSRPRR